VVTLDRPQHVTQHIAVRCALLHPLLVPFFLSDCTHRLFQARGIGLCGWWLHVSRTVCEYNRGQSSTDCRSAKWPRRLTRKHFATLGAARREWHKSGFGEQRQECGSNRWSCWQRPITVLRTPGAKQ